MTTLLDNASVMMVPVKIEQVSIIGAIHHLVRTKTDFFDVIPAIYEAASSGIAAVRAAPVPFCTMVSQKYPHLDFGKTINKPAAWNTIGHQWSILGGYTLALQHDSRGRGPDFNGPRLVVKFNFDPRKRIEAFIKYANEDMLPNNYALSDLLLYLGEVGASIVQDAELLANKWHQLAVKTTNGAKAIEQLSGDTPRIVDNLEHIDSAMKTTMEPPMSLVAHVEALLLYLHNRLIIR